MTIDRSFLGQGWSFPPEFNKRSKTLKTVAEEDDIRESLRILLATTPGERIMQPTYGCRLNALLFESINESTITEIRDIIERAILFFEPRINLDEVRFDLDQEINGLLKINLFYTIRGTNSRSNMVYPFYFLEGTNIRK